MAASIALVMVCGGDLNRVMLGLKGDLRENVAAASTAEVMGKYGNGNGIGVGGAAQYPSPQGTQAYCFDNGICLNIPIVDGNTPATLGSNGGELTHSLSTMLHQLAQQLREQGADPSLVAMIEELSKRGHTMGYNEQAVLDACPPTKGCSMANSSQNSDAMFAKQWAILDSQDQFQRKLNEVNRYLSSHPGALSGDMKQVLGMASHNVNQIAAAFGDIRDESTSQSANSGQYNFNVEFDPSAPRLTHMNANTIHGTVLP